MNTRDLEYFVALVDEKNFSQVATRFAVTQPTITMALKRLESAFAIQLIDRDQSHGQLTVTPAGQQLYTRAMVIINQLHLAEVELGDMRQAKIRFGLPPINGAFYFPTLAPRLMQAHLMDRIETVEAGSENLLTALRSGHLDIALLGADGPLNAPDLDVRPVTNVPFTIVMPKNHPLAQQPVLDFAQLVDQPFVTLSEGFVHTKALAWFIALAGIHPSIVYRTANVTLLKQMIHEGVGISFLAQLAVTKQDDLRCIPLQAVDQPQFCISVVTRRGQVFSPQMQQLLNILK